MALDIRHENISPFRSENSDMNKPGGFAYIVFLHKRGSTGEIFRLSSHPCSHDNLGG